MDFDEGIEEEVIKEIQQEQNPQISQKQEKQTNIEMQQIEIEKQKQNPNQNKQINESERNPIYNQNKNLTKKQKAKKIIIDLDEIEKEYLIKDNTVEGEIVQNDAETMIKLEKEKNHLLPRKLKDGKLVKHGICDNFGWFGFNGKFSKSEIEYLGIGTEIYFKILKVFIICFFVISLLNIPLFYIYFQNNSEKKVLNYNDALFKFTIGNIASSNL